MGPLLGLLLLAATPPRPFADERLLLDRRLETLRRMLPDGPTPAADVALVADLARTAGLSVEARARAPLERGGVQGDVPVDLTGSGRFGEIDRFFRHVALSARLIDVETVTLTAGPGEVVRFSSLLRFA
ncbi:MAG TPA: type 4a pilus biogenesis protein PilO, partial [Vicinamibacteria bacterium]|nr:type 4a pilus biogenesis protein PilO [Vicinamibacteria bacterium]